MSELPGSLATRVMAGNRSSAVRPTHNRSTDTAVRCDRKRAFR